MDSADDRDGVTTGIISVVVIDDHTILRDALSEILDRERDIEVVAEAADGATGVAEVTRLRPDVVILDVEIPGEDVMTTVTRLRDGSPESRLLILTMHRDMNLVQSMVEFGVAGFLHKSAKREALLSAIRTARDDSEVVIHLSWQADTRPNGAHRRADRVLTARELEVVERVARAMSNRQIATELAITEGTVKRHLRNIFDKLVATSRLDMVNRASAANLISPYRQS